MAKLRLAVMLFGGLVLVREAPLQAYEPCYQVCGPNVDCSQECEDYGTCGNYESYGGDWCYDEPECGNGICEDEEGEGPLNCYQDCELSENYFDPGNDEVIYPDDGIAWSVVAPSPDGGEAADCFGNCGSGCSDHVNPCGGAPQYWQLQVTGGPYNQRRVQVEQCIEVYPDTFWKYRSYFDMYGGADLRWTYHGWVTGGCIAHDGTCPEWAWLGCVIWFGCGSGVQDTWSYTTRVGTFFDPNSESSRTGVGACHGWSFDVVE